MSEAVFVSESASHGLLKCSPFDLGCEFVLESFLQPILHKLKPYGLVVFGSNEVVYSQYDFTFHSLSEIRHSIHIAVSREVVVQLELKKPIDYAGVHGQSGKRVGLITH